MTDLRDRVDARRTVPSGVVDWNRPPQSWMRPPFSLEHFLCDDPIVPCFDQDERGRLHRWMIGAFPAVRRSNPKSARPPFAQSEERCGGLHLLSQTLFWWALPDRGAPIISEVRPGWAGVARFVGVCVSLRGVDSRGVSVSGRSSAEIDAARTFLGGSQFPIA